MAVTFRQRSNELAANFLQPAAAHHVVDAPSGPQTMQTLEAGSEDKVFPHPHLMVERAILRHVADAPPHFERIAEDVVAVDGGPARGRRLVTGQNTHGCRFPRAIGAAEADDS